MLRETTSEKAFAELLNGNEKVYVFDEDSCQIQSLAGLISNMRLIVDFAEAPAEVPAEAHAEAPAEEVTPEPSNKTEEALEEEKNEEEVPVGKKAKWDNMDYGKIAALRKAKWSVPKIADEMRCPSHVIYNYFKKNGDPIYECEGAAE